MTALEAFNALDNREVSRKEVEQVLTQAKAENNTAIIYRLSRVLNDSPEATHFEITITHYDSSVGLSGVQHTGDYREALDDCGRLRKGWKFVKGNVIKVEKKEKPKKGKTPKNILKLRTALSAPHQEDEIAFLAGAGIDYFEEAPDDQPRGLGKPIPAADIYNMITDKIIKMLKSTKASDYKKTWKDDAFFIPLNYDSKKPYRGVNRLLLQERIGFAGAFRNPYFLTFKQIKKHKGTLKKGAKGYEVIYYSIRYVVPADKNSGRKAYSSTNAQKVLDFLHKYNLPESEVTRIPMIRYYNVYNGADIENIDFKLDELQIGRAVPDSATENRAAQLIVENYPNPPAIKNEGNQAYYNPASDYIKLPKQEQFDTVNDYYRTLFHELTHSTGHNKRLNRGIHLMLEKDDYAKEELVAEFGAVFLSAWAGIMWYNNKNHAAYLKGWNSAIKEAQNDNKFLMRAASLAQQATDYILNLNAKGEPAFLAELAKINPEKEEKKTKKATKKPQKNTENPEHHKYFQEKKKEAEIQLKEAIERVKKSNYRNTAVEYAQVVALKCEMIKHIEENAKLYNATPAELEYIRLYLSYLTIDQVKYHFIKNDHYMSTDMVGLKPHFSRLFSKTRPKAFAKVKDRKYSYKLNENGKKFINDYVELYENFYKNPPTFEDNKIAEAEGVSTENVEDSSKKKVEKAPAKATKSLKSRKEKGENREGEQKELDLYMQEMKMAIKESKAGKFDKKNILSWLSKFPDKVKGLLYNFLYHHYLLDQEEAKLRKSKKLVPFGLISVQAGINEFVSKLLDLEREDFFDLYFFFRDNMDECIELLEDKEVKKNYYEKKKKGLSGVDYSQGLFGDIGLNAPRHEGILKEALTEKGKLKKGWYFQDYGIIDPKGKYHPLEREFAYEYKVASDELNSRAFEQNEKRKRKGFEENIQLQDNLKDFFKSLSQKYKKYFKNYKAVEIFYWAFNFGEKPTKFFTIDETNPYNETQLKVFDKYFSNKNKLFTRLENYETLRRYNLTDLGYNIISEIDSFLNKEGKKVRGDIKKINKKYGLNASSVPEVSTERFKKMSVPELREYTLEYYLENYGGKSISKNFFKEDNIQIEFFNTAGKKLQKPIYKEKVAVLEHLESLIKNSTYNNWGNRKESSPPNIIGYLNFKAKVTIDGEKRHVRISIAVDRDRKFRFKTLEVGANPKKKKQATSIPAPWVTESLRDSSLSEGKGTKKSLSRKKKEENFGLNASEAPVTSLPVPRQTLAQQLATRPEVRESFLVADEQMSLFLGALEKKTMDSLVITLTGKQGSGKTRFAFQFMNALAQRYRVGHASIEEHPESVLYEEKAYQYLNDTALEHITAQDVRSLAELDTMIRTNEVIVIDSFQKMRELAPKFEVDKDLRKKYDGKLFLVIFQQTADGKMRGGSKSQFDGDIILFTETFPDYRENYVYPDKNRYNKRPATELQYSIYEQRMLATAPEVPALPAHYEPMESEELNFEVL